MKTNGWKKWASLFLATCFTVSGTLFSACSTENGSTSSSNSNDGKEPLQKPTYAMTATASTGGSVVVDKAIAKWGEDVTFTVTPNEGYAVKECTVNGTSVELSENTYTLYNVLRAYEVKVSFVKANILVSFAGEGTENLLDQSAKWGKEIGSLPKVVQKGKRFIGWKDEDGKTVSEDTLILAEEDIVLTAEYVDLTETEVEALKPFTKTTCYFDQAATKYGVSWHTLIEPIAPQIQIIEGNSSDFSNARVIECDFWGWIPEYRPSEEFEYAVQGVVDCLEFAKTYTVRFGDAAADVWCDTYTFTTREETIDEASFIYIADTQETFEAPSTGYVAGHVLRNAFATHTDVDFITHGGDIVNWGGSPYYWEAMMECMEEYLFNYPMMATAGNHEDYIYYGYNYSLLDNVFNVDCLESGGENGLVYSFDYGPVHYVVLRSNDVLNSTTDNKLSDDQMAWLEEDLAEANENPSIKWKIAMIHEMPFKPRHTLNSSNYNEKVIGKQLVPVFTKYGVDLLLGGHDHFTAMSYPIVWDESADEYMAPNAYGDVYAMGLYLRSVATLGANVVYDGDEVKTFEYTNASERGTVYYEIGCAGSQTNTTFDYTTPMSEYKGSVPNTYFSLFSGGIGSTPHNPNNPLSMYAYIEVKQDKLILRNYGVDYKSMYTASENEYVNHGYYLDGFMLTK